MNFGQAIEALKQGKKVTRKGWNGKGMFLWLKPSTVIKDTVIMIIGITKLKLLAIVLKP